tara:strand:+ start:2646 stop:3779 length:1134 start_codon:yes stop_codon:yes gene_type:complete
MLTPEQTPIEQLQPYKNNARLHSDAQVEQIAKSIEEFGFLNPVLVDDQYTILAGHGRVMGAKKLGIDTVPTIQIKHLSESQKKAYIIADNQIALNAGWEMQLLETELKELNKDSFDVSLLGFDAKELDKLLYEEKDGLTDEDAVPENVEPRVKKGDLWQLGNHRLLCGDATSESDVARLMDNQKADMVFTDPPYGLNYEYNSHKDKEGEEYLEFCNSWFPLLEKNSEFMFLTTGWKYNKFWLLKEPDDIFYWISRNKQSGGKLSFLRKVEPIFLWGKPKKKYNLDYFDYNSDKGDGLRELHTCPKPVKFVIEAISILQSNDIVLDVFLGSGTTIIACEKTNRSCYGLELDPEYCDVIIKRWEDYTGQTAKLLNKSEL